MRDLVPVHENTEKRGEQYDKAHDYQDMDLGVVVMVVGGILILASSLALAAHIQNVTAGNTNNFNPNDNVFWTLVFLIVLSCIVCCGGFIAQFVAWIGAVLNTYRLVDRTWFNLLLWGGIAGIVTSSLCGLGALFGLGLMIAYLVAGPDAMAIQQPLRAMPAEPTTPPKTLLPTG